MLYEPDGRGEGVNLTIKNLRELHHAAGECLSMIELPGGLSGEKGEQLRQNFQIAFREIISEKEKDAFCLIPIALEALCEMYAKIHSEIPEYESEVKCLNAVPVAGKLAEYLHWEWEKKEEPKEHFGMLKQIRLQKAFEKKGGE